MRGEIKEVEIVSIGSSLGFFCFFFPGKWRKMEWKLGEECAV